MADRPSLARALYDAVRALPARERAAFDRLIAEEAPSPRRTGAARTREALAELRSGGGERTESLQALLGDT